MGISVILLTLFLGFLFIWYKRWARLYNKWEERGVVHRKPYPFIGNMLDNVLKKRTIGEVLSDIATEFKDQKYIGVYNFITADLMITDPEDVQNILIKDFSHFTDRGPKFESKRMMDRHLFLLTGAEWKGVRTKVSPAFSSGKLKGMFPLMIKSYEYTSKYLDKLLSNKKPIDSKDILEMYIVSVSASTIYGMDPSRLADPQCEFKQVLDQTTKMTVRNFVFTTIAVFFPKLLSFLDVSIMGSKIEKYFIDLVLDTFKERSQSGQMRDDIIQQLLQLKQTGKIEVSQWIHEDEEELGSEPTTLTETVEITDDILVSQGFIFLMAGFDPLKATLAILLVELCQNKHALDRAVEEVKSCVKKHDGFTQQAVKEMEYLDWCLSETLRLYPAAEMGARTCVKDYTFPNGITVEAGTRVLFPILRFQRDPTYFPEPDKFKPERFENPPPASVYLPFGQGPRMCIARRFALQEMKLFVALLLNDYDISLNPKTELPVRNDKWFFLRRHASDIYFDFKKRTQ